MQTQSQSNSISISDVEINLDELFTHIVHLDLEKHKALLSALYNPKLEPNLIQYIEYIFGISSDFKQLPQLVELTDIVISHCNPYCWEKISPLVNSGLTSVKFSTKLLALNIIGQFATRYPEATAQNMPEIMAMLISTSTDPKPQVKAQVNTTFNVVVNTIENVDVKHLFQVVISAYTAPAENTQKALDALIATPFVNDIDIPTMGFLVPLLTRSMKERKMVYQRRAAVVIQTLCKLLKNPVYAKPFYGVLQPVLTRGFEEIADPEIRQVCANSLEVLNKVHAQGINKMLESYTHEQCVEQYKQILAAHGHDDSSELVTHSADLVWTLIKHENKSRDVWAQCISPYLASLVGDSEKLELVTNAITETIIKQINIEEHNPEDDEENLCDCVFSLAYGTRVLLHQTPFKVKVGRKYGVLGPNGAGKSTLMRAIANKNLQEFPEHLRCLYIEHDIQGNKSDMSVLEYVLSDDKVVEMGVPSDEVINQLVSMGFDGPMINGPVTSLSGGWRMKLSLSKAMVLKPDMLLLDEPTNHLDEFAVKWLVDYIQSLKRITCLVVSHDTKFLDKVCTNIIHYEGSKLKFYSGNLTEFLKIKPEAKQYYELTSDNLQFRFPDPSPIEGVKSLSKAVLSMKNCYFQYPTASKPQLSDVSIKVSQGSRVVIAGVNGAGKSTLIKLLLGEIEPNQGTIERHPNVCIGYIAQHAFHHIEDHLEKTPIEYVMWRYRGGYDKESINAEAFTMTEEEMNAIKIRAKENKEMLITELVTRRTGKREHEYEAKNDQLEITQWFTKTELIAMGYEKMIKEKDLQIAMESQLGQRKLTTGEIQRHFDNFELGPEFAQHTKIGALSGGQKMRCTLAGSTWSHPNIIILDEPTNFLDRDSIGALSDAIKHFKGGILVISHNSEFYKSIGGEKLEQWLLEGGKLTIMNGDWADEVEKARKKAEKENSKKLNLDGEEEKFDSLGNKVEVKKETKELDRNEKKRLMKLKKDMEKRGEDTYDIDVLLGLA
jgi:elongation factor 3